MLIIHSFTGERKSPILGYINYNVYMGSSGNKYIFNIAPANEQAPAIGTTNLGHLINTNDVPEKEVKNIKLKAENIMGKTLFENYSVK